MTTAARHSHPRSWRTLWRRIGTNAPAEPTPMRRTLRCIRPHLRGHRLLITWGFIAMAVEILFRLLEPWPVKIVLDSVSHSLGANLRRSPLSVEASAEVLLLCAGAVSCHQPDPGRGKLRVRDLVCPRGYPRFLRIARPDLPPPPGPVDAPPQPRLHRRHGPAARRGRVPAAGRGSHSRAPPHRQFRVADRNDDHHALARSFYRSGDVPVHRDIHFVVPQELGIDYHRGPQVTQGRKRPGHHSRTDPGSNARSPGVWTRRHPQLGLRQEQPGSALAQGWPRCGCPPACNGKPTS